MLKTPGARKGEFELYGMDLFTQQTATLKVTSTHTLVRVWLFVCMGVPQPRLNLHTLLCVVKKYLQVGKNHRRLAHTLVSVYIKNTLFEKKKTICRRRR